MPEILLASTSKYRKAALESIGLVFTCISPPCDENEIGEEHSPKMVAEKRAQLKASSVAKLNPDKIVIGSDQLAHLDGKILGKPGTKEKAISQLQRLSGKTHELITSLSVVYGADSITHTDVTCMTMKELNELEIQNYVEIDQPVDCAGSYKIEKNGMWLFSEIKTEDHSAIQGLPLLALMSSLEKFGYHHLREQNGNA